MSIRELMNSAAIDAALVEMAAAIRGDYAAAEVGIVGIHTGGVYLADRIHALLSRDGDTVIPSGSLDITLYRDDWSTIAPNPVVRQTDIDFPVTDYHLILVDDVIFTGRTIRAALDAIMDYGRPKSIKLAVLVDRSGRELPVQPDYSGLTVDMPFGRELVDVQLKEKDGCDRVVVDLPEDGAGTAA